MKKNLFWMMVVFSGLVITIASCKKDKTDTTDTCVTFSDTRDSQSYTVVKIGSQCWMSKNLNYAVASTSWCYNNVASNCTNYGRVYTWTGAGSACPSGWHLPTDAEWKTLEISEGMTQAQADNDGSYRGTDQGTKLKVNGASGFNALLSGLRDPSANYNDLSAEGYYWTSTVANLTTKAYRRSFSSTEPTVYRGDMNKDNAFSVRCVKN